LGCDDIVASFSSSNNPPSIWRIIDLRLKLFMICIGILLINGGAPLFAAVSGHIELKDGTLLKGKIFGMANGVLRVRAAASMRNPIPLRWQEVTGLATEEPVTLVLDTGVTHEGRLQLAEPGSIHVLKDQNAAPVLITLESVTSIQDISGEPASSKGSEEPDEIILKNGMHLIGTIVSMEEKTLTVKTAYAGDLSIQWDEVEQLQSRTPLSVQVFEEEEDSDGDGFRQTSRTTVNALGDKEGLSLARVRTINIPNLRYKGSFDLGGNRTKGNTDTTAVNASTNNTVWTRRHRGLLNGKYAFASADGDNTAKNARGTLGYDYFITKKLYSNSYEYLEYDKFQGLDLRSTTGLGLGYQFLDTPSHSLSVSIGPAYVYEKFKETGTTKTATGAWAVDWEYDLIADRVHVYHRQKGFRDLGGEGSTALRWTADQGARIEVYGNLYLKVAFEYRYNSDPEPGKKKSDEAFIWALGYAFSN
jgi:putative salt-induced outer membrane protein YdiY